MNRGMNHNPDGKRSKPGPSLPPVPFDVPESEHDETKPTGRIIRQPVTQAPFTAQDAIDVIRKMTLQQRRADA